MGPPGKQTIFLLSYIFNEYRQTISGRPLILANINFDVWPWKRWPWPLPKEIRFLAWPWPLTPEKNVFPSLFFLGFLIWSKYMSKDSEKPWYETFAICYGYIHNLKWKYETWNIREKPQRLPFVLSGFY